MALIYDATLTPGKDEVAAGLAERSPWGAGAATGERLAAYRLDDPEGRVGLEALLMRSHGSGGDGVLHVPISYRDAPLEGVEPAAVMQHSVLGERYAYDGLLDPAFTRMLAALALTGDGQAVTMMSRDGGWLLRSAPVRFSGGGWTGERLPVDGLRLTSDDADGALLVSDHLRLWVARRPRPVATEDDVPFGEFLLTATWPGLDEPRLLAGCTVL